MRKIAIAPGFGGFKVAEVQNGTLAVHTIPAVVGIGSTDLGYLGTGFGRQNKHQPHTVTVDGTEYLVGQNVHRYAPPVERLDYQRLDNRPELRALLYAAPQSASAAPEDPWRLLRDAAVGTPYSQEYLSLLARTGRLEASNRRGAIRVT